MERFARGDDGKAHAHVERLVHLLVRDLARLLEYIKYRMWLYRSVDVEQDALLQPDEVLQASPCHIHHARWLHLFQHPQDLLDIYLSRGQELHADGLSKALELRADEVLVFEDSRNGVLAAQSAGMRVVAVLNPVTRHLDTSFANLVLHSLADLPLSDLLAQFSGESVTAKK